MISAEDVKFHITGKQQTSYGRMLVKAYLTFLRQMIIILSVSEMHITCVISLLIDPFSFKNSQSIKPLHWQEHPRFHLLAPQRHKWLLC